MGNVTGYFRPLKHQNHLSRWASDWILETVFGEEDEGIILGGHDHEGCDILHRRYLNFEEGKSKVFHDELRRRRRAAPEGDMLDVDGGDVEVDVDFGDGVDVATAVEENFDYVAEDNPVVNGTFDPHPLEEAQHAAHLRNNISQGIWEAVKYTPSTPGIREITVRSMMGDFQGNVGLLTASYNHDRERRPPNPFP